MSRHGGRLYPRARSVSMNCWLNSDAPWNGQNQYKVMRKISDMTFPGPTGIWVITDEREDRIITVFFVVDMAGFNPRNPGGLQLVDIPASYHNGAGRRPRLRTAIRRSNAGSTRALKRGSNRVRTLPLTASSPNNRDVLWLRNGAPGPHGVKSECRMSKEPEFAKSGKASQAPRHSLRHLVFGIRLHGALITTSVRDILSSRGNTNTAAYFQQW